MGTASIIAWLAWLWYFCSFIFRGFRIGSLFTSVILLAVGALIVIFFTCRWLFTPSKKQKHAAEYLISGIREKHRDD